MFRPILYLLFISMSLTSMAQQHPNLTLTKDGVQLIRKQLGQVPLFDQTVAEAQKEVDEEIELGIIVPIPKDMAGGFSHERHKRNFFVLQKAGNLYQITNDKKYANYVKEYLMAYAKMYPTLGLHPTNKSYATGKIFWQCLNDANWLVYVSQAYDCIYDYLSKDERDHLEKDLFIPYANFLSTDNPKFFNRIHNHSTWANAAVGMIALVMDNDSLLQRSLYGLENDGIDENAVDNDGGYIKVKGNRKAGFLSQLDYSFSPDGYFTEGPYYLRYAIFPYLVFAKALHNKKPELDILNYRDGILEKGVDALLHLTDENGLFLPINDSQKGMSWGARELILAVDFMYTYKGQKAALLDIASKQNKVALDETGFAVAKGLIEVDFPEFERLSKIYGDGEDGTEGGLGIVRQDEFCLAYKYSAQGMGHGHFDKLSYSLYDDTGEIIQDYGAVRWVNVDQKGGGRYLPENKTFGKQSIAHNTLVIDEVSHYRAKVKLGEAHHPTLYAHDLNNPEVQLLSAVDEFAYSDTKMHRTLVLIKDAAFDHPLLLDLMKVNGKEEKQYDLPLWYMGHLLNTSFEIDKNLDGLKPLGTKYGYEHIWNEGSGKGNGSLARMSWFGNDKFYTVSSATQAEDEFIFGRAGANDPNFNLRSDPVYIQRRKASRGTAFASIIEAHGDYHRVTETPSNPFSKIKDLKILYNDDDYSVVKFEDITGTIWTFALSTNDNNKTRGHLVTLEGEIFKWTGVYQLKKSK